MLIHLPSATFRNRTSSGKDNVVGLVMLQKRRTGPGYFVGHHKCTPYENATIIKTLVTSGDFLRLRQFALFSLDLFNQSRAMPTPVPTYGTVICGSLCISANGGPKRINPRRERVSWNSKATFAEVT